MNLLSYKTTNPLTDEYEDFAKNDSNIRRILKLIFLVDDIPNLQSGIKYPEYSLKYWYQLSLLPIGERNQFVINGKKLIDYTPAMLLKHIKYTIRQSRVFPKTNRINTFITKEK
jgi:hypothetical protein